MRSRKNKEAAARRSDCVSRRAQITKELEQLEQSASLRADFRQSQIGLLDREIRDMYFSVESTELRCKLIAAHRNWVTLGNELMNLSIQEDKARVEDARREGTLKLEIIPPLIGILAVYLGNDAKGLVGAVGGAVVGIFAGLSYIRANNEEREFLVAWAQSSLDDAIKTKREDYPYPHRFTEEEAETGERDDDYQDVLKTGVYV